MATTVSAGAARLADAGTPASLRRDPVLLGLLGLGAVLALWYASDLGGAAAHVRVFWVVQLGMDFGFVLFSARIARLAAVPRATRRFWRFITVGGALFFAGDAVQTIVTLAHPDPTATAISPVQLVLLGLGAACCVLAMLTHPAKITGRGRLRFALDAGTIMAGATIFVWYFQLGTQSTGDRAGLGMVAVTSALMLVATFGLVKLLFGGNPPFTRRAGILGGLATALSAVTTGLGAELADTAHPDLRFVVQLLPCFLIVATPRVQELQVRADPGVLNRARTRPYNLLPYGAVGAVQALLVLALLSGDLTVRTWGVVAGVVLITALVVIRQLVAFADNNRLLVRIDRTLLTVRRQEERFRSLVQHASDITAVVDADAAVSYASPAIERILGLPTDTVVGRHLVTIVHPNDQDTLHRMLDRVRQAPNEIASSELRMRHVDGTWRWLDVIATNRLDDPAVGGVVCNARDVTESLEFRDRLRHEATHDPLTGLANRALFGERLRTAPMEESDCAAVLLVDLDDFKIVNDTLGHHVGDALLIEVADRLRSCARGVDTVARLGGDEFALFLPGATATSGAEVAQRVLDSFAAPVVRDETRLTIKASIGVAAGPTADTDALQRAADAAMYDAKRRGKGSFASTTLDAARTPVPLR